MREQIGRIHQQEREMIQKALGNAPQSRFKRVHGVLDRTQGWQGRRATLNFPRASNGQLSWYDYAILRASTEGLSPEASTTVQWWKQQITERVREAQAQHVRQWNAPTGEAK